MRPFPFVSSRVVRLIVAALLPGLLAVSCAPQPAAQQPGAANWLDIPLTNVVSGQTFRLSDLKGKVVLIETMAVWCTTCTRQQIEIRQAHSQFGDSVVSVSLDIDPNENKTALKRHAETNGFAWAFAVSPPSLSQQLGRMFGDNVLNPTATPVIILARDQSAHPLRFGLKSSRELAQEIGKYLRG